MEELLRTNDPVLLSWLSARLADENIEAVVLDTHTSAMEGSISAIPRRVMVESRDLWRARKLLDEAEDIQANDVPSDVPGGGTLTETPATRDSLLGGRVTILQPAAGYRAAIDPVLLAAAVPAKPGETVLDVGSGTGAAALALAARLEGVRVTGLEADGALTTLAQESAGESGLSDRVAFVEGDLLTPPSNFKPGGFDHVMANPPYLAAGSGNLPPDRAKRRATVEGDAVLGDWLRFSLEMLRDGGTVTVIHRFDRKDEVIEGLAKGAGGAGGAKVFPLWPKKAGEGAKRVIVQAVKGVIGAGGTRGGPRGRDVETLPGLVLHLDGGDYTPDAEAVLRSAEALSL